MALIKDLFRRDLKRSDDYTTPLCEFMRLRKIIPKRKVILDPFFNEGAAEDYISDAFDAERVIHEEFEDYFNNNATLPECDIIVTNGPFSRKYDVLKWLISTEKPFCSLFPLSIITTKKFHKIPGTDNLQYILPTGRIRFEKDGEPMKGSAIYACVWITSGMDLKEKMIFI